MEVIIEICGGVVQNIKCEDPKMIFTIIDYDEPEGQEITIWQWPETGSSLYNE